MLTATSLAKFEGTVYQLLLARIPDMVTHPAFKSDVLNPLQMDRLMDLEVRDLQKCVHSLLHFDHSRLQFRCKIFRVVSSNEWRS